MQKPLTPKDILNLASGGLIKTASLAKEFRVSRQYAARLMKQLVREETIIIVGRKPDIAYTTPEYAKTHVEVFPKRFSKKYTNKNLEEHMVLEEVENNFPRIFKLKEHVRNIFTYAFSEMFNNAIEHSRSKTIEVNVGVEGKRLFFSVRDWGIGVFRNVMHERNLRSELEAIQDLLKGKVTTAPRAHSGEGIFFTSKAADLFVLNSYGHRLTINNPRDDISIRRNHRGIKGTQVYIAIETESDKHLDDVFKRYTNTHPDSDYGFDKTEVRVKLYLMGGIHVSRSQARRVLSGLEKFKTVILDFENVPTVGQAFADEIFRVFKNKHSDIQLIPTNMNEGVNFMINRVEGNNPRSPGLFNDMNHSK